MTLVHFQFINCAFNFNAFSLPTIFIKIFPQNYWFFHLRLDFSCPCFAFRAWFFFFSFSCFTKGESSASISHKTNTKNIQQEKFPVQFWGGGERRSEKIRKTRTKDILTGLFRLFLIPPQEKKRLNFDLYLHESRLSEQSDGYCWHQECGCHRDLLIPEKYPKWRLKIRNPKFHHGFSKNWELFLRVFTDFSFAFLTF